MTWVRHVLDPDSRAGFRKVVEPSDLRKGPGALAKGGESDLPPWLEAKRVAMLDYLRKAASAEDRELAIRAAKEVLAQIDFYRANAASIEAFKKAQRSPKAMSLVL